MSEIIPKCFVCHETVVLGDLGKPNSNVYAGEGAILCKILDIPPSSRFYSGVRALRTLNFCKECTLLIFRCRNNALKMSLLQKKVLAAKSLIETKFEEGWTKCITERIKNSAPYLEVGKAHLYTSDGLQRPAEDLKHELMRVLQSRHFEDTIEGLRSASSSISDLGFGSASAASSTLLQEQQQSNASSSTANVVQGHAAQIIYPKSIADILYPNPSLERTRKIVYPGQSQGSNAQLTAAATEVTEVPNMPVLVDVSKTNKICELKPEPVVVDVMKTNEISKLKPQSKPKAKRTKKPLCCKNKCEARRLLAFHKKWNQGLNFKNKERKKRCGNLILAIKEQNAERRRKENERNKVVQVIPPHQGYIPRLSREQEIQEMGQDLCDILQEVFTEFSQ